MNSKRSENAYTHGAFEVQESGLQPAPSEVLDDLAQVREQFLGTFTDVPQLVDMEAIEEYFDEQGLSHFPIVTIPFTKEASMQAREIVQGSKFPQKFLMDLLSVRDFNDIYAIVGGWSVPAYRLNFQFDTGPRMLPEVGEYETKRASISTIAHELTHSIFYNETDILVEYGANDSIATIYEYRPLSGSYRMMYSSVQTVLDYEPIWIEEAIAVHMDGQVALSDVPEGPGLTTEWAEEWGKGRIWLDEQYIIRNPKFPNPARIPGAVAGQALDMLNDKIPGTIQKIFDIARGKADAEQFRTDLREGVGDESYSLMFKPQPYTKWADIYRRIGNLGRVTNES